MKELIKVRIDKSTSTGSWYANKIGAELFVKESGDFEGKYDAMFVKGDFSKGLTFHIDKSDCTIIDTGDKERHPSRTDDLYLQIFEKHGLRLNDNELNEIIDIAVKSVEKENPEEWVPQVGGFAKYIGKSESDVFYKGLVFEIKKVSERPKIYGGGYYLYKDLDNLYNCSSCKCVEALPHEIPAPEPIQEAEERITFDIEKWKTGRYDVVQRNGLPAEILKTDLNNEQPLVVAFSTGIETQGASRFSLNGRYYLKSEDDRDLFLIPKTETVWVNHFESPEYTSETMAINESAFRPNGYKLIETIEVKRPIK